MSWTDTGLLIVILLAFSAAGCRSDMQQTPRANTFRPSRFFEDQIDGAATGCRHRPARHPRGRRSTLQRNRQR